MAAYGAGVTYPWEQPSPEIRAVLKKFCDVQQEKYGPDWKRILARQMAEEFRSHIEKILTVGAPHASR